MSEQHSLKGKIALVTGGTYGIGMAMAKALGKAGAIIIFNARRAEAVTKAEAEYRAAGLEAYGYTCDVTKEEEVKTMITDVSSRLGNIDILVNNAGIIKRIPALEMSVEEFSEVIDIDLIGPFIVSKAVVPGMIDLRERGGCGKGFQH